MSLLPLSIARGQGSVTVYLRKREAEPHLPYELNGVITPDVWSARVAQANRICKTWSRPWLERIYFICIILLQFTAPFLIARFALTNYNAFDTEGNFYPDKYFQYRAITMGVFLGIGILVWVPLIIWKTLGKRKVTQMTREWRVLDEATTQGGFIPRWTVSRPGIFSSSTAIKVTIPQIPIYISSFHPAAPLPPYINPPGYGYGFAPPAGPPQGYTYPVDEKHGMENVRV